MKKRSLICMTISSSMTYRWQQVLCSRAYSPLFDMQYIIWSAVHELLLLFIDTKFSSKILSSIISFRSLSMIDEAARTTCLKCCTECNDID